MTKLFVAVLKFYILIAENNFEEAKNEVINLIDILDPKVETVKLS